MRSIGCERRSWRGHARDRLADIFLCLAACERRRGRRLAWYFSCHHCRSPAPASVPGICISTGFKSAYVDGVLLLLDLKLVEWLWRFEVMVAVFRAL